MSGYNEEVKKRIAERAYHLFLARGGEHGYQLEDWLKAEKEIKSEIAKKKRAGSSVPKPKKPRAKKSAKK
ncbi:MAG: DUF2934 domain-containing protein [Deltaproteobacteria bacterium]|nr:MAG: DUF2934 domain-containing protein [Deltaproteobacteria bacterium]